LCYTNNNAQSGVTQTSHRFWGTASNAEQLGGFPASNYITAGSASFSTVVNFADVGYTVGNPVSRLRVFNNNATTPTIQNQSNNTIVFQTTVGSTLVTPLQLVGADVLPGVTTTSNLGSTGYQWANVYATNFNGNASTATGLLYNSGIVTPSVTSSPNTLVIRDSSGTVNATIFNGASTTSYYADLAEKYLPDADYPVGTVVSVGGDKEVTASSDGDIPIGVVSGQPAYLMNKDLAGGLAIALKGRVPVNVVGPITKGNWLIPTGLGNAWATEDSTQTGIFAISLETSNHDGIKLVECVIL
jgi:hypothetical protein